MGVNDAREQLQVAVAYNLKTDTIIREVLEALRDNDNYGDGGAFYATDWLIERLEEAIK